MPDLMMLIGRVLLSVLFVMGGYGKLMEASATQAHIAAAGLPLPMMAYAVAVFVELFVGLAFLLGFFTRSCGLVLAVWCVVTAAIFHSNFADTGMMIHFMKNLGIAGGMLYAVASGGGVYSLDAIMGRRRLQTA
jgi:putative oxidoreductase